MSGGTLSLVEYVRLGVNYNLGVLSGSVPVEKGDSVKFTYVVAPTVTFIPL